MSDNPPIKAELQVTSVDGFQVGPGGADNAFSISIRYQGKSALLRREHPALILEGRLGEAHDSLALDSVQLRGWVRSVPPDWTAEWQFPEATTSPIFVLRLSNQREALMMPGETLEVSFSRAMSSTAAGIARLPLSLLVRHGDPLAIDVLRLEKRALTPGILSFRCQPGGPIWPGDPVTLSWTTFGLKNLELMRDNTPWKTALQGEGKCPAKPDRTTTYRLRGWDGSDKEHYSEVEASVATAGWHSIHLTLDEGDPGWDGEPAKGGKRAESITLQPVRLFSVPQQPLYGVFRHRHGDGITSQLFTTSAPLTGWRWVATRVPGSTARVPDEVADSPGVLAGGSLWLAGGSQVDPDRRTNALWRLPLGRDTDTLQWQREPPPPWSARMGHGVAAFKGRLWVMGGRDNSGNVLNDVWSAPVTDQGLGPWQRHDDADWAARCIFSPCVFGGGIWFFGGGGSPFPRQALAEIWHFDGKCWQSQPFPSALFGEYRPIAGGLVAHGDKLELIVRLIQGDDTEVCITKAYRLEDSKANRWTELPIDALQAWGDSKTFACHPVCYRERCLVVHALAYYPDHNDDSLRVYLDDWRPSHEQGGPQ